MFKASQSEQKQHHKQQQHFLHHKYKRFQLPISHREILCPRKTKYEFSIADCWFIKKKFNDYFDKTHDISTFIKNQIIQDVADRKYVEKFNLSKMDRREQLKFTLKTTIMEHPKIPESIKLYIKKKKFEKEALKSFFLKGFFSANGGCGCAIETETKKKIKKRTRRTKIKA
jgi:hypothetical protein